MQSRQVEAVSTTANITEIHMVFPTYFLIEWRSFAPNICATGIANPVHTPWTNPSTRKFIEPVEPTPASAFIPRNCPTIAVSTML